MKTVYIVYGFAEGPRISSRMRRDLRGHGYKVVKNPRKADILLAHSGGCYMLPSHLIAKLIVLINPPMWLNRRPLRGLSIKVRQESKSSYWYKKTLLNVWYLFSRPIKWKNMRHLIKQGVFSVGEARVILVRNQHDSFMHPSNALACATDNDWSVCSVVGGHDDLWETTGPYIGIITQLYDEHGVSVG